MPNTRTLRLVRDQSPAAAPATAIGRKSILIEGIDLS
jgi:hypothetical protein